MTTDVETSSSRRPASRRVADLVRGRIEAGEYEIGEPLPPYRQLAAEYGVAVNTAIAAVRLLRNAGLVTIRPNSGAYVRDPAEGVEVSGELAAIRGELAELRGEANRVGANLEGLEGRLAQLAERLSGDPGGRGEE